MRNKAQLKSPIYIKPDFTPEDRARESMLLKERRSLIDKGVERKQIKLRSWGIYINDKPHCKIVDSKLKFHETSLYAPVSTPNSEVSSPSIMETNNQSG